MNNKIILDLCGGTGAWSKPYEDAGYDVRIITLPDNDVRTYTPPDNVYGILAAPPCTMFSLARTRTKIPRDLKLGMEVVIPCLNIILECRFKNKLAFWSLENPMGILRQFLGKPAFTFDPCDFGDKYTKKTDLWGWFNTPKKNLVDVNQYEMKLSYDNKRNLPTITDLIAGQYKARRAITPPGFAQAFYEANK